MTDARDELESWQPCEGDAEARLDLAAERDLPAGADEAKARIRAAVLLAVGPAVPPATGGVSAGMAGGAVGKALLGLAVVSGLAVVWFSRDVPAGVASSAAEAPVTPSTGVATPSAGAATTPSAGAATTTFAAVSTPSAAPPETDFRVPAPDATEPPRPRQTARATSTLGAEQALLANARVALAGGDVAAALSAIDTHGRRFAGGRLAEERDVLRIQAFARAGRTGEARGLADRFRRRYPGSLLQAVVDYAVGAGE